MTVSRVRERWLQDAVGDRVYVYKKWGLWFVTKLNRVYGCSSVETFEQALEYVQREVK